MEVGPTWRPGVGGRSSSQGQEGHGVFQGEGRGGGGRGWRWGQPGVLGWWVGVGSPSQGSPGPRGQRGRKRGGCESWLWVQVMGHGCGSTTTPKAWSCLVVEGEGWPPVPWVPLHLLPPAPPNPSPLFSSHLPQRRRRQRHRLPLPARLHRPRLRDARRRHPLRGGEHGGGRPLRLPPGAGGTPLRHPRPSHRLSQRWHGRGHRVLLPPWVSRPPVRVQPLHPCPHPRGGHHTPGNTRSLNEEQGYGEEHQENHHHHRHHHYARAHHHRLVGRPQRRGVEEGRGVPHDGVGEGVS